MTLGRIDGHEHEPLSDLELMVVKDALRHYKSVVEYRRRMAQKAELNAQRNSLSVKPTADNHAHVENTVKKLLRELES